MNYNFNGSLTQRNINLGSVQEASAAELAEQARNQRAARQEVRARHAAATHIQSLVRGRKSAQNTRSHARQVAQQLLAQLDGGGGSGSTGDGSVVAGPSQLPDFQQLTRWTAAATRRTQETSRKHALTPARVAPLDSDDELLLAWSRIALRPISRSEGGVTLLSASLEETSDTLPSVRAVARSLLAHLDIGPGTAQAAYLPYLQVLSTLVHILLAPSSKESESWALWLTERGLHRSIRSHILNLTQRGRSGSTTLQLAIQLALAPLRLYSATPLGKGHPASPRVLILGHLIENILTIGNLPVRIPRASLALLAVELPIVEVADYLVTLRKEVARGSTESPAELALLANFGALGWKRIPHFPDGASVKAYMLALTKLQDDIPYGSLFAMASAKTIPECAMIAAYDDTADRLASRSKRSVAQVDTSTMNRLQILASQEHITALLTASAKYPNSTREALCAFLASSLQSWDVQTQDKILACVAYRYGSTAAAGNARSSAHTIGGLVRELWRGWIRGSKLARSLSSETLQSRKGLTAVLNDESLTQAWPCLIMLCQLYSRSLLTLGDDEFYPVEDSRIGSSAVQHASRNPLTLDEIVTLSGLLRNLAFAMYWNEGTGGALNDLPRHSVVGMAKMDLLSLRNIVTRLLQQLHQRDSRRQYAPDKHWLMNSEMDLNSFIQSVVLEEDELNRKQDEEEAQGPSADDMDVDAEGRLQNGGSVDSDDQDTSRPTISTRLANHRMAGARKGALTARNLAYLSPRLGVLNNIPFVIPFEVRVEIFHQFTALDYARLRRQKAFYGHIREVTIRRDNVAQDGFTQLNSLGEALKHRFAIKFIDKFGIEESGIDGGGLFKEFLTSLIKEAFDTDRGLWSATSDQQLYPNSHSYAREEDNLQWYRFLGRILGKALYQGILVDINFASFFLSKWLGRGHGYLDDLSGLESLDKEVYRNLLWLKHYAGDVEKELALDFTVLDEEFGEKVAHELVPNGKNIPVTRENRLEYIYRVSHYRLNEQIRQQSDAFMAGLTDIIDLRWLRMLDREELRILISGAEGDIDLDDLRVNTVLGGYHEKDEAVQFFWTAMASFTHDQRKAFLKFTTSCPSPPLLGFAQLNPKFGIRHGGDDVTRLPSASTCVNLLKLPRYTSYEQCREKLLYAIESGAGFDLS